MTSLGQSVSEPRDNLVGARSGAKDRRRTVLKESGDVPFRDDASAEEEDDGGT